MGSSKGQVGVKLAVTLKLDGCDLGSFPDLLYIYFSLRFFQ
jgi:hypothetical protein